MQYNPKSVALQIRLLLVTVLIGMLGFALVSQSSPSLGYNGDSHQVFVAEAEGFVADAESLIPDSAGDALPSSYLAESAASFAASFNSRYEVLPRFTSLYHVRPRSPPAL